MNFVILPKSTITPPIILAIKYSLLKNTLSKCELWQIRIILHDFLIDKNVITLWNVDSIIQTLFTSNKKKNQCLHYRS